MLFICENALSIIMYKYLPIPLSNLGQNRQIDRVSVFARMVL